MKMLKIQFVLVLSFWGLSFSLMAQANEVLTKNSQTHDQVEILHYEKLPPMALESWTGDRAQHGSTTSGWTWSFESFGKSFDLLLESNDRLIAKLPARQLKKIRESHQLYRGKIDGIDHSWVRLTRNGKNWYGMIWDGHEVYIIDPMSVMESALPGFSLSSSSSHGIYRLSDTREVEGAVCGSGRSDVSSNPIHNYEALVEELQERVTSNAIGASLNLDMAVVADVEFSTSQQNSYNISANAAVIARMNVVDGVFSEQVGVQINLVDIQELSNNGSLTSTVPLTLLQQFGGFMSSGTRSNPGVAHLFTGRELDGSVIGIAYISTLCSERFGVGVNEVKGGGTARALLVAHELGHNFGAPHDNQGGSACASTPNGFIMNPIINGSDQFSQCSIAQMQTEINRASCITVLNLNESDLQVTFPNNSLESLVGASFGYSIHIQNNGPDVATNARTVVTAPSGISVQSISANIGSCTSSGAGQFNCDLGNISTGETRTIALTLLGQTSGQFSMQAFASASNDPGTSNNTGQGIINILNVPVTAPKVTSPISLSQLTSATMALQWTAHNTPVLEWWLYVGSSQGSDNVLSSGSIPASTLSRTVTGIPTDGSLVWVRLWWRTSSNDWQSVDVQYTAVTQSSGTIPQIVSPTPGSLLPGATVAFSWIPNGLTITKWWLYLGGSQGSLDLADSGSLGTQLSHTVTGLPTDGRTIWVRLWYQTSTGWKSMDRQYTAATQSGGTIPEIISPTTDSQFAGSTVVFRWRSNGLPVTKWWLHVGGSKGELDLADSGSLGGELSYTATGLPTDGRAIWVRLWYQTLAGWQSVDRLYTADGAS